MTLETAQSESLALALDRGMIGVATIDERLIVAKRNGRLSHWLPPEGAPACDAPLLLNMETSLAALKAGGGEFVLPSMRAGAEGARVTVVIAWNESTRHFLVVTTPDHAADQIERLLAPERREKQLLQQQAEASAARLRVADALYRDIVESSDYFILRLSVDLKVVYANALCARFLGLPREVLVGRAIRDLFPPQSGAENPWRLDVAAERTAAFELAARDARGALRWLRWGVHFLGDEAGGEFQAMARDATAARLLRIERERAQEEARAAAVANERLLIANDLHDTLVRSIVTMIAQARLVARATADESTREALREFDVQAREGLREAREAIQRTRESRRLETDLRAIVRKFAVEAHESGVAVESDWGMESGALSQETEELFARVLREALRNIELHAGATRVRIGLRAEGDVVTLRVEDNGAGFNPQAETPGHFGVAGMRERAERAGASLRIDSAPGQGTRLILSVRERAASWPVRADNDTVTDFDD